MTDEPLLEDGVYDALVVDADQPAGQDVSVDLTILDGPHKGEVVAVKAESWSGDPLDLLGIPATVTVAGGQPSVRFEP